MRHLGLILGVTLLLGGCAAPLRETHHFPGTWPGTQTLAEAAPTVSVQPIRFDFEQEDPGATESGGLPTAAVLSVLFIKHLHVNGVNAILESAETSTAQYTLGCTIPRLSYGVREEGYPQDHIYKAELTCTLRDELAQKVVWERNLKQDYERAVLLDLMTKLPKKPHEHDRILYRECIVPLWDVMASTVGTVLVSREQLAAEERAEPGTLSADELGY